MKQTAVEWLEKIRQGQKVQPFDDYEWEIAFNHAKEMEKQQIIQFANEWYEDYCEGLGNFKYPEDYYNETFKSE